jgi:hypothetical protein
MGNSDISRNAFDPAKHYSSVRMQQGRVMVDDDWNENERIRLDQQIRINHEVIGDHGTPDDGFKISIPEKDAQNDPFDINKFNFKIKPGTYYIEGLRVVLDGDGETYLTQNNWLNNSENLVNDIGIGESRTDFVYLEAWQQPVTAVEDEELFESALGGPDTSTRIRKMHRVRVLKNINKDEMDCFTQIAGIRENWRKGHDQKLTVSFTEEKKTNDLCSPSVQGGYLGAENQAIRVQMTGDKKFIWGYNNASPVYKFRHIDAAPDTIDPSASIVTIELASWPKDEHHWPKAGQVIELLSRSSVLSNGQRIADIAGILGKVKTTYDPDSHKVVITIKDFDQDLFNEWKPDGGNVKYPFLRVWDQGPDYSSGGEIELDNQNQAILQNTGLKIKIEGTGSANPGDFWIIAARPETPDRVVPWELTNGMAPHGVRRFFAPLAFITWTNEKEITGGQVIHDCRRSFRPLTELGGCCTFMVGDGKQSNGDYNSIEEALANLPEEGGKICVLAGEHIANVTIDCKTSIWIMGCGDRTIVSSALPLNENGNIPDPVFLIRNSENIRITDMTISALFGTAILLEDTTDQQDPAFTASQDILVCNTDISALEYGIRIKVNNTLAGNNNIEILNNIIEMLDDDSGKSGICCLADNVLIERNRVVVLQSEDVPEVAEPGSADDHYHAIFDRCNKRERVAERYFPFKKIHVKFRKLANNAEHRKTQPVFKTLGGIQIEAGSEFVKILHNEIIGGKGNGITLGSYFNIASQGNPDRPFADEAYLSHNPINDSRSYESGIGEVSATISEILIENNLITNMGWNGIASSGFNNLIEYAQRSKRVSQEGTAEILLTGKVEDLLICRNSIIHCAQQYPGKLPGNPSLGGIFLGDSENVMILDNSISDNGVNAFFPVCGILIYYGERIEITHNRILNNGKWDADVKSDGIINGFRWGICVELANKMQDPTDPDGIPAAKIHDNVITQPYGQTICLTVLGPVSIVGNQLTTQNADINVNPLSVIAGTVFILNLGISKDYIWKFLSRQK